MSYQSHPHVPHRNPSFSQHSRGHAQYDPSIVLPDGSCQYLSDIKKKNDIANEIRAYQKNAVEYLEHRSLSEIQYSLSTTTIFTSFPTYTEYLGKNLCSPIRDATKALIDNTSTHFLNGLIMILSQVLTALQGNVRFNIKDDWHEYPSIYVIGTASSGSRKSQIISRLLVPFNNFATTLAENTISDDVGKECKRYLKKMAKEQVCTILNSYKENPNSNGFEGANEELLELSRQNRQLNNSILSSKKIYSLEDFSYTGLMAALENNDGHIAVTSAEGGIIDNLTKDSKILECFKKGYGFEEISRRTSSKYTQIAFPSLQLLLYVQPSEVLKILNSTKMHEQGLTARFIFLPENVSRDLEVPHGILNLSEYGKRIPSLLKAFHCTKGNRNIHTIHASPQAANALAMFEMEIQRNILPTMPEKSHPALRKLHGIAARLALAYHFWQYPYARTNKISASTAQIGVDIARALIPRLYEVYHEYGLIAQPMANKIVNYILSFDNLQSQKAMREGLELSDIAKGIHKKIAEVEKGLGHLQMCNALCLYRTANGKCKVILHHNFFNYFASYLYTPHYQSLR